MRPDARLQRTGGDGFAPWRTLVTARVVTLCPRRGRAPRAIPSSPHAACTTRRVRRDVAQRLDEWGAYGSRTPDGPADRAPVRIDTARPDREPTGNAARCAPATADSSQQLPTGRRRGREPQHRMGLREAAVYHQRWEHESAYYDLRHTIMGGRVLRSGDRAQVTGRTWGEKGRMHFMVFRRDLRLEGYVPFPGPAHRPLRPQDPPRGGRLLRTPLPHGPYVAGRPCRLDRAAFPALVLARTPTSPSTPTSKAACP